MLSVVTGSSVSICNVELPGFAMINEDLSRDTDTVERENHDEIANSIQIVFEKYTPVDESNPRTFASEEEKESYNETFSNLGNRNNNNAENILQNDGTAGMFGIQQHSHTFTEQRVHSHSEAAVNRAQIHSPGGSPNTGSMNLAQSLIETLAVDNDDAVNEDVRQHVTVLQEAAVQTIATAGGFGGTNMSYDDDMNDIF